MAKERHFSPEARERIAAAQRKRWRKWRKEQKNLERKSSK